MLGTVSGAPLVLALPAYWRRLPPQCRRQHQQQQQHHAAMRSAAQGPEPQLRGQPLWHRAVRIRRQLISTTPLPRRTWDMRSRICRCRDMPLHPRSSTAARPAWTHAYPRPADGGSASSAPSSSSPVSHGWAWIINKNMRARLASRTPARAVENGHGHSHAQAHRPLELRFKVES